MLRVLIIWYGCRTSLTHNDIPSWYHDYRKLVFYCKMLNYMIWSLVALQLSLRKPYGIAYDHNNFFKLWNLFSWFRGQYAIMRQWWSSKWKHEDFWFHQAMQEQTHLDLILPNKTGTPTQKSIQIDQWNSWRGSDTPWARGPANYKFSLRAIRPPPPLEAKALAVFLFAPPFLCSAVSKPLFHREQGLLS